MRPRTPPPDSFERGPARCSIAHISHCVGQYLPCSSSLGGHGKGLRHDHGRGHPFGVSRQHSRQDYKHTLFPPRLPILKIKKNFVFAITPTHSTLRVM